VTSQRLLLSVFMPERLHGRFCAAAFDATPVKILLVSADGAIGCGKSHLVGMLVWNGDQLKLVGDVSVFCVFS
jgi:hypothetical protein